MRAIGEMMYADPEQHTLSRLLKIRQPATGQICCMELLVELILAGMAE